MKEEIIVAFCDSIERGANEEVGSIDTFEVDGKSYLVNKTGRIAYTLFEENSMEPLATYRGTKAETIFLRGFSHAAAHNEMPCLYLFVDSTLYTRAQKQKIVEAAAGYGVPLRIDARRLYNGYTRRQFKAYFIVED